MESRYIPLRTPMTAVALSLLLAACGGDSDSSNTAVSASPDASTTLSSTDTTNADGTGSSTAGDAGSSDGSSSSSEAGSSQGGSTNASVGAGTPSASTGSSGGNALSTIDQNISDRGISGNVLRSMLDHQYNKGGPRDTPSASPADGRYGWYLSGDAAKGMPYITIAVSLNPNNYVDIAAPGSLWPFLSYRPLNGSSEYRLATYVQSRDGIARGVTVPFRRLSMGVGISSHAGQLSLGRTMTLGVGPAVIGADYNHDSNKETVQLSAASDYRVNTNTLLPFGQAIQTWSDSSGQKVELVLQGSCPVVIVQQDGQLDPSSDPMRSPGAELCWNVDLKNLKRQICMMYEVPTEGPKPAEGTVTYEYFHPDSRSGIGLIEMADERSVYGEAKGSYYWRQWSGRCEGKGNLK